MMLSVMPSAAFAASPAILAFCASAWRSSSGMCTETSSVAPAAMPSTS